jgi:intracellular multiplication protein IcmQ
LLLLDQEKEFEMESAVKKKSSMVSANDSKFMLKVLKQENKNVEAAAEELYDSAPVDQVAADEYCQKVIQSADNILASGDWDSSPSFRNLIKPIVKMRDNAKQYLSADNDEADDDDTTLNVVGEDQQLLYVSLFQARGHDVSMWEKQVRSLNRYIVGRPIYAEEANVKKVIRLKENSANEAYVVLAIDKKFIQKPNAFEVERKDRYGNSLETLKPRVISDSNIIELVHDDQRYHYIGGRLKKA